MWDPKKEDAEVDAAEKAAHEAIDRLMSLIRYGGHTFGPGKATNAVLALGRHIATSAYMVLKRSEDPDHRLRLVTLLERYGVHDPDTTIEELGYLATSDEDYDVRDWALEARDKVLRHQRLEEALDC
jgi:hypothetical protein